MKLLFDSHFLIGIIDNEISPSQSRVIDACSNATARFASVASLWEIAIKLRLGKLRLDASLAKLPELLEAYGFTILDIDRRHAIEGLRNAPATKDPFDQLLLAQCQVDGLHLVTLDRALVAHPLAWRET